MLQSIWPPGLCPCCFLYMKHSLLNLHQQPLLPANAGFQSYIALPQGHLLGHLGHPAMRSHGTFQFPRPHAHHTFVHYLFYCLSSSLKHQLSDGKAHAVLFTIAQCLVHSTWLYTFLKEEEERRDRGQGQLWRHSAFLTILPKSDSGDFLYLYWTTIL